MRLAKLLAFLMLCLLVFLLRPWEAIPPAWSPWEPLSVEHAMTPVTRWKLSRLANNPTQCRAALATAPDEVLAYTPLEDYTPIAGCPLANVVRIERSDVSFSSPFTISCSWAVTWVMFERNELQRLALTHLDSKVTRIDHYGSFACRNVYNRAEGRRSQHATASAFDIAGFRLANGERVSVLENWAEPGESKRTSFLQAFQDSACDYFGTVLGPDYNRAHANHFHLDTSNYGFCR
ncbi:extensin family protein [Halopseudomonas sp.]|uniref:extensin-like domain-containing protein n=1 Tax=Halopseudomonas sp. TaxID=2901191 RepID=UPI003566CE9E